MAQSLRCDATHHLVGSNVNHSRKDEQAVIGSMVAGARLSSSLRKQLQRDALYADAQMGVMMSRLTDTRLHKEEHGIRP